MVHYTHLQDLFFKAGKAPPSLPRTLRGQKCGWVICHLFNILSIVLGSTHGTVSSKVFFEDTAVVVVAALNALFLLKSRFILHSVCS